MICDIRLEIVEPDVEDNRTIPMIENDPNLNVTVHRETLSCMLNGCNYYSEDGFVCSSYQFDSNDFSLYHVNIRSLPAHFEEFLINIQF